MASLETPLGEDVLAFVRFDGTEGMSELFEYRVECISQNPDINFDTAIGRGCVVKVAAPGNSLRAFHGILASASTGEQRYDDFVYHLVLRPWFWLLTHTTDCRIFHDMTVDAIVKKVFADHGFAKAEFRLTQTYPTLEYTVQYRETAYAFVSRLLEQHGIFYFFDHTPSGHTMVLADASSAHKFAPLEPAKLRGYDAPTPSASLSPEQAATGMMEMLRYVPEVHRNFTFAQYVDEWSRERRLRTGKVTAVDYNFKTPNADMTSQQSGNEKYAENKLEVYDYPGKYISKSEGSPYTKTRLDAEQATDWRRFAAGDAVCLTPGFKVGLYDYPNSDEDLTYIVVRCSHHVSAQSYRSVSDVENEGRAYHGNYEFQPLDRVFRAPLVTPKPMVYGPQTAKVITQSSGEEIDADEHGRILVQFFWDREPAYSCRVRVAQVWAGKGWGGQYIPRVGMEAMIVFLEGDPDRPLCVGTVYNADNTYPYKPDKEVPNKGVPGKTQSGWKTRSSKGGSDNEYNEFRLDDNKNSEQVYLRAQKDHDVYVRNCETWDIGEVASAKGTTREATIHHGDDKLTVEDGNRKVEVKFDHEEKIHANQKMTIDVNRSVTVKGDHDETVNGKQTITVDGEIMIESKSKITLKVMESTIEIGPASITVKSPQITVQAQGTMTIDGGGMMTQKAGMIMIN